MFNATWVFITVLDAQNRLFDLNLEETIAAFWQEFIADYINKP